ncbi:plastocyanin/azurin family copper-binding protein [Natronoarchaeum philippinense]|nr:plastocyanin/azurin family copper-binding protein [Natronoarchaeum philippinense]
MTGHPAADRSREQTECRTGENGESRPRRDAEVGRRGFLTAGATAGGALWSGAAAAQTDGNQTGGNETGQNETGDNASGGNQTGGAEGGGTETVELVDYAYEPGTDQPLQITPGTTVQFVWITDNHNINVDDQPDEAAWEGYVDIENAGFEYEFTFDTEGTYEFHCDPHQQLGMEGTITVGAMEEGGGDTGPVMPGGALALGVATMAALLAVTFLAYFLLKYGGEYEDEP